MCSFHLMTVMHRQSAANRQITLMYLSFLGWYFEPILPLLQ